MRDEEGTAKAQICLEMENERQLLEQIKCREKPVELLLQLLGRPKNMVPPSIFIYGLSSCGKTYVTSQVLMFLNYKHVIVDCIETYTPKLLFGSILTKVTDRGYLEECDNMYDFINGLQTAMSTPYFKENAFIIVLDHCDRLRDMESFLLQAFLSLHDLSKLNVCVIFISTLTFERFYIPGGLSSPVEIFFPQYNKDEIYTIICSNHKWKDRFDSLYTNYARFFLSVFFVICRDLNEISHMVNCCFLKHCEPIISGEVDSSKLWSVILPFFKTLSGELYLRMLPSESNKVSKISDAVNFQKSALSFELPFYSKFFLIAAYLASYSPQKLDKAIFVKHNEKKRRNRKHIQRSHDVAAEMLLGPKSFSPERLLAVFYAIVEGEVNFTTNISAQISSLVKLQLLTAVENSPESQKYKCVVGLDFVNTIAKTVGFDVKRYLFPPK